MYSYCEHIILTVIVFSIFAPTNVALFSHGTTFYDGGRNHTFLDTLCKDLNRNLTPSGREKLANKDLTYILSVNSAVK